MKVVLWVVARVVWRAVKWVAPTAASWDFGWADLPAASWVAVLADH